VRRITEGVAVIIAIIATTAAAQNAPFFPMGMAGGVGTQGNDFLPDVESLGRNWAWVGCNDYNYEYSLISSVLREAQSHGIKVLLGNAGIDDTHNVSNLATGHDWQYEAETLIGFGDVGQQKSDPLASRGSAWLVAGTAGWFQDSCHCPRSPVSWTINGTVPYTVRYTLRVGCDDTSPTLPVCSLAITE
jgi:hypothetical protein